MIESVKKGYNVTNSISLQDVDSVINKTKIVVGRLMIVTLGVSNELKKNETQQPL